MAAQDHDGEKTLRDLGFTKEIIPKHFSVKEAVFPFLRYQGIDIALGPEMKSTGEVMGIDADLGLAYAKSQMAAPPPLPKGGNVFISVKDDDKPDVIPLAREFVELGFQIIATSGTGRDAGGRGRARDQGPQDSRRPASTCSTWSETETSISSSTRQAGKFPAKTKCGSGTRRSRRKSRS